ncbi:MAG: hypothetical protein ACYTDV_16510, partial [Planctomycetota bacterium]
MKLVIAEYATARIRKVIEFAHIGTRTAGCQTVLAEMTSAQSCVVVDLRVGAHVQKDMGIQKGLCV